MVDWYARKPEPVQNNHQSNASWYSAVKPFNEAVTLPKEPNAGWQPDKKKGHYRPSREHE